MGLGIGKNCQRCSEQLSYEHGYNADETLCTPCKNKVHYENLPSQQAVKPAMGYNLIKQDFHDKAIELLIATRKYKFKSGVSIPNDIIKKTAKMLKDMYDAGKYYDDGWRGE